MHADTENVVAVDDDDVFLVAASLISARSPSSLPAESDGFNMLGFAQSIGSLGTKNRTFVLRLKAGTIQSYYM